MVIKRKLETLFDFKGETPKVTYVGSGGFSSLFGAVNTTNDIYFEPHRVLSNKPTDAIEKAKNLGLDATTILSTGYDFEKQSSDRDTYFGEVADWMDEDPSDIIALSGLNLLIPKSFLNKFPNKIVNIHPADLAMMRNLKDGTLFNAGDMCAEDMDWYVNNGVFKRAYTGNHAVLDALVDGQQEYGSTLHFVNLITDGGMIIARKGLGKTADMFNGYESITEKATAIQEKMKNDCDIPVYIWGLNTLATKKIQLNEDTKTLYLNGAMQQYGGQWIGPNGF